MPERCDYLISRREVVGLESWTAREGESTSLCCLRQEKHKGPHLVQQIRRLGGKCHLWEKAPCEPGTCDACDSEDPEDDCISYREVSVEEARRLILDPTYEGE